MDNIKDYFITLKEVLSEKKLEYFWIICGQKKFKPLNITRKEIQEVLKENVDSFRGKSLAEIRFIFAPINEWNIQRDKHGRVLTISIYIYEVNEKGLIDTNIADVWQCNIFYNKKELDENHVTIDELKEMINMVYKRKIVTDMAGITYTNWLTNYNRILDKKKKKSKSK